MKNSLKFTLTFLSIVYTLLASGQLVTGNVQFQSSRKDYSLITIQSGATKTMCDSLGRFEIENALNSDTIEVIPIPIHIKVKLYNLPDKPDTLTLDSIPLFDNVFIRVSVVNFKSKRASKKYSRSLNKKFKHDMKALKKRVNHTVFVWDGKEYELELVDSDGSNTILIDLKQGN